ncbi:hypothetical protein CEXT_319151, partial [Caerostris extrusa]
PSNILFPEQVQNDQMGVVEAPEYYIASRREMYETSSKQ